MACGFESHLRYHLIMTIKRNHWTNEEVMKILSLLKLDPSYDHYNYAIDQAADIFSRFEMHFTKPEAIAYLTDEEKVVGVGPR